jgi:hypothetical protein
MVKDLPRLSFRHFVKRNSHAFFVLSPSEGFRVSRRPPPPPSFLSGFVVAEFRRARLNKRVLAFTGSWQALTLGSAVVDRRR